MTEEQVKTWIDFLRTNPPKARGYFRRGDAFCAIGVALDLFRPLNGRWGKLNLLDTNQVYFYHRQPGDIEVMASATLSHELLDALGLDSEIATKIQQENDATPDWAPVIKVIERELA